MNSKREDKKTKMRKTGHKENKRKTSQDEEKEKRKEKDVPISLVNPTDTSEPP